METLKVYEKKWGVSEDNPHKISNPNELISFVKHNLDINEHSNVSEIQSKFKTYINNLILTYNDLKSSKATNDFEIIVRINRLLELVYYARSTCVSLARMIDLQDLNNDYRDNVDANLFRFSSLDQSKNNHYQN